MDDDPGAGRRGGARGSLRSRAPGGASASRSRCRRPARGRVPGRPRPGASPVRVGVRGRAGERGGRRRGPGEPAGQPAGGPVHVGRREPRRGAGVRSAHHVRADREREPPVGSLPVRHGRTLPPRGGRSGRGVQHEPRRAPPLPDERRPPQGVPHGRRATPSPRGSAGRAAAAARDRPLGFRRGLARLRRVSQHRRATQGPLAGTRGGPETAALRSRHL